VKLKAIMLLVIFSVIALLIIFKYISTSPKHIGAIGESRVAHQLIKLDKNRYSVLNDVLLKYENVISQIDHIVVSIYGIFVIETKNYNGWIFGNENSEYWTQVIYRFKSRFRNPIKQNWSHIFILKKILSDFKNIKYHPIVVFSGNAELKTTESTATVTYVEFLYQIIHNKSTEKYLTIDEVNRICNKLHNYSIDKTRKNRIEHSKQIFYHIDERKEFDLKMECPKCGNMLVYREGRFGPFWGCSNFPKCHYTKKY
jgi:hypothetical protein